MQAQDVLKAVALFAVVIAAFVSGGLSVWNTVRLNKQSRANEEFKGAVGRDLEHLKAKLGHGQLISSTQWQAEFNAYQTLWKTIVPLRGFAEKMTKRDSDLGKIGVKAKDLPLAGRIASKEQLLKRYAEALTSCMLGINEHAPFYEVDIRRAANEAHAVAYTLYQTHLAALTALTSGIEPSAPDAEDQRILWETFVEDVDTLEGMIRKRMRDVSVVEHP